MIKRDIAYMKDFSLRASELELNFGVTNLFQTGFPYFDEYLGGGYGRTNGYEIVLLYGATGIGKSLVSLNIILPAIKQGKKVGLLVLEDEMADVLVRLKHMLEPEEYRELVRGENVICLPEDALESSWKLDELLLYIEEWYTELGIDLILLDHLQFAFEGAEALKGENEYIAQRVFMQKLNRLMKRMGKTIILVSHINKGSGSGMDRIVGSGSIAQAATKVIEVRRTEEGNTELHLHKSRFTSTPKNPYVMRLNKVRLEPLGDGNQSY